MAGMNFSTRGPSAFLRRLHATAPSAHLRRSSAAQQTRILAALLGPVLVVLAGCAGGGVSADPTNPTFSIAPGTASIDTNCTGCNATNTLGTPVEQFNATMAGGGAAAVTWSLSGGDTNSGPGTITPSGQYTPPSYVTADRAQVVVTATMNKTVTATAVLTLTPGFLQPLSPENAAVPAGSQVTITGTLAEAGGFDGISFALANSATGSTGGQGSLGDVNCQSSIQAFTTCTVVYTAPATITSTGPTWVVATVGHSASITSSQLLLNSAGIASNPASHEAAQAIPVLLGSSGGNNNDYDLTGNQVADCCGGTLGSLIEDSTGRQYVLSNNHVLARSDHASVGDAIIQPGLIDNSCTPNGDGPGTTPVASLTTWLPLSTAATNADAAIAQVGSNTVSANGSILELGARQADGSLAAAPPGVSSTSGKGEPGPLALTVAKSGRTTGLTCGAITAVNVDVTVDYYDDCAETKPYLTKTFTNQIGLTGNAFSDAGDSGALVIDVTNAEPVGLYFTGGMDATGTSQAVASPASDVLSELAAQTGSGVTYSFVGGADHAVSCLNYGAGTAAQAQARPLAGAETARGNHALALARLMVDPKSGILGVAAGSSSDHPGEAAVLVYVDEAMSLNAPSTIDGVRTVVIPTNARAVAQGTTPKTPLEPGAATLSQAAIGAGLSAKQQIARRLMKDHPAFFGIGVGQSLDNPREAALTIYVDRKAIPAEMPATINGVRTRYILMDRMHVTRSYDSPIPPRVHCMARPAKGTESSPRLADLLRPLGLKLD
jgi:hypothetical protein